MFENVIADLLGVSGVKGVYIADSEGMLIESESVGLANEEMSAALIVDLLNKATEITQKLSSDSPDLITVEGKKERIIISKAGNFVLGIVADMKSNYGLLKIEMKKAVDKIVMMV
ncbi:MAG: roadblock/LC7 domain-containing protein [Archaeoglobaceae archaeon]|nr:roadblock/LC7 domain-containing protein [Archaeoglobaceae archaeon]MDW8127840.1 roadblock/LC7 domain-containing protein [Archaeoglobaceae archaeon]